MRPRWSPTASRSPPPSADRIAGAAPVPQPFSQEPLRTKGGQVRVTDSSVFQASKTIAAVLEEIEPGGMRELHWHPNVDEWQYYLAGQARMTVFAVEGNAGTFDYQAGDVGYVPRPMPHYIENTGTTTLRLLALFRSGHYADISLAKWLALTSHELVRAHLKIDESVLAGILLRRTPVVPA